MQNIVIVGSGGHARLVINTVELEGRYRIAGLVDGYRPVGEGTLGYTVLGREEDLPRIRQAHAVVGGIVAIGDNYTRSKVVGRIREVCPDFVFVSTVHPAACVAREVEIAEGVVVMAGTTVNPCCRIGSFCFLSTQASLDHDSTMAPFASLGPRATTGGDVSIGSYAAVSIGATLIHGVRIGAHTVIGAGATVLRSVDDGKVAYGTPARVVRDRQPGERYL